MKAKEPHINKMNKRIEKVQLNKINDDNIKRRDNEDHYSHPSVI